MKLRLKAIIILLILTGCTEENNGIMLKPLLNKPKEKTYVIASPLAGKLLKDNQPLANVKITRKLTWNANETGLIQEFFTDDEGNFSLPLHEETFKMGSVLTQFVANQSIYANYNGEKDTIWVSGQLSGELFAENDGKELKSLICDLSYAYSRIKVGELLATKCRWDNVELETYDE